MASQPVEFLLLLFASVEQLSPRHFAWWNDITALKCDQDSKLSRDKKQMLPWQMIPGHL